jgi:hypothetical protein
VPYLAMKVFLSWSGDRSKAAAESLGNWTARVIQAVEPWISSGIEKGARWQSEIADRLEDAKVGIVCLTATNLSAPWILFEAGALSKTKGSYVCTFLLDVTPADVEPPLAQFQHTVFQKEEVFKLMQTINGLVESNRERSLGAENLAKVFEKFWPDLKKELGDIASTKEAEAVRRSDRQLFEEILEILRRQEQRAQAKATPVVFEWKPVLGSEGVFGVAPPLSTSEMYDKFFRSAEENVGPQPKLDISPETLRAIRVDLEKKAKPQRDSKPQSTET